MSDDALRRLATAQMQRGRDLMASGQRDATLKALPLFDYALAIRRGFPQDDARNRYDCAGAWLNRAEALVALGEMPRLESALAAFDAAVDALDAMPLDGEPKYGRRLAIALQNRALVRRRLDRDAWKAMPELFRALAVLSVQPEPGPSDLRMLRATVWMHVADGQLGEGEVAAWRRALESARMSVDLLAGLEEDDPQAASIGLKARHICCGAVARCLSAGEAADSELVSLASDAVDSGLALIARWERQGRRAYRSIAADLLEYGRRLYGAYQPQFAREFEAEFAALRELVALSH